MENNLLKKLNEYTRREFKEDEVYIFSVVLCDNEIDRDNECFSVTALNEMKSLFLGKTGIFDHNARSQNQTARIFETEVVTDEERLTKSGEAYSCLKATAYMVRTKSNEDLIKEIDGGIKKEVSVSCSAGKRVCSICGADTEESACIHKSGKKYGKKVCYFILSDITDAYEWSFVAVPAQINAGVTKKFEERTESLRKKAKRLCFLCSCDEDIEKMSHKELEELCARLEKSVPKSFGAEVKSDSEDISLYKMKREK